jgi:hypothetical protein
MNFVLTYTDVNTGETVRDDKTYNKKEVKKRRKELMKKKLAVLGSIVFTVKK